MRIVLIAVVIVLTAAGAIWSAAPAPTGTITGTVENFTGGRRPAAGQQVKLTAYVNNAEADWQTATTDARGQFTFSVVTAAERSYVANIKYKGGDYDSVPVTFKAGERRKTLTMRVYEPSADVGILRVNVHHMIVEIGRGAVQIAELLVFANPTDRTYVGAKVRPDGKRDTLVFSIPPGARNVEYLEGLMECCVFATPGGLQDTMDVKPGIRAIGYSYTLPSSQADLRIVRTLDYRTERVEVFGSTQAQMQVTPLAAQPAVTTEQGTYARFSGATLGADDDIALQLAGLPVSNATTRRLALAAFAGVIAAALVYPLLRRGTQRARAVAPSHLDSFTNSRRNMVQSRWNGVEPATREELVAAIARLDDEFEAGRVPRPQYEATRARYKRTLMDLLH